MKNHSGQTATAPPLLAGFSHIIDDGDCNRHGFFLPKQTAVGLKSVCNSGVGMVDVPVSDLRSALVTLSANQKRRLAAIQ